MEAKKYRVICWQPSTSRIDDEIFVDIAPENGVIHNMMFYSRLKLYRGNDPKKNIIDRAKSVYLCVKDEKKEPEIVFEQMTDVSHERLIPLIIDAYKKMREDGRESTLSNILSAWETERMAEEFNSLSAKKDAEAYEKREKARRMRFAEKHNPQTPQEERRYQNEEEFSAAIMRRQIAMQNQAQRDAAQDPISRMKEKMRQYEGD